MNGRQLFFSLGIASIAVAGTPDSARAQQVAADIHIGGWPVAGTIHIGDRYGYPRPRRVIYERPRRIDVRYDRGWQPWKHRDARVVVVYYDREYDQYYEEYGRGLEEIRVYRDGNRFYQFDGDNGYDRYDRGGRFEDRRDRDSDRDWDRDHDRRRDRDRDDRWRNRDHERDHHRDNDDYDRDHRQH